MNFRSKARLNNKVGGQNHLNDDVLFEQANGYGVPEMWAIQNVVVRNMTAFTAREIDGAVHFFLQDFALNRVWNRVQYYGNKFENESCVLTPDFSLFTDMPIALQIFNTYRSRYVGRYWQEMGLKVVPSVTWSEEKSFDFCVLGIPRQSIVAISTQGVKDKKMFLDGFEKMIESVDPFTIWVYGTSKLMAEIASYGIETKFFMTHFELKRHGWKR